ncbi:MAG: hypothetical protein IEMM0008_0122 [bacterium]|nr:MAG: hypothetical protein IEMM0008_0122 [bacterium]
MDNLSMEVTKSTPFVFFDAENNVLEIKGESYPENPVAFYNPILGWLKSYLEQLKQPATFDMTLEYLNTSSSKAIMRILDMLEKAFQEGKEISINWHHDKENEAAQECGLEFKEDLELPFNIIEDK